MGYFPKNPWKQVSKNCQPSNFFLCVLENENGKLNQPGLYCLSWIPSFDWFPILCIDNDGKLFNQLDITSPAFELVNLNVHNGATNLTLASVLMFSELSTSPRLLISDFMILVLQVGDKVNKGQVLCIIEAMKLMNEIEVSLLLYLSFFIV